MLTDKDIEDLIYLRISEDEAMATLSRLTPSDITAPLLERFLHHMRLGCEPFPPLDIDVMDCCGTGGSGLAHFNTSTASAFVLAAGGVPVVKFGNRGMTSKSGSFDLLESLGIPITYPVERLSLLLERAGLAFLFAPQCYPAFAAFNQLRRSLKMKTIFNFLGPLLNPARPSYRLLGVSDPHLQKLIADHLHQDSQTHRALVVRGENGLDEIDCNGESLLYEISGAGIQQTAFTSRFTEQMPSPPEELTPQVNKHILMGILNAEDNRSPYYQMVCLNAGAGFYVYGAASSIEEGKAHAADLLAGGKALETLNRCRRAYADYSG